MPIYKLIEYSNNHSKTSGKIWQYYREEPALVQGGVADTKSFKIMVPLKYLGNFWRTLEMQLVNCKINVMLTQPLNVCITSSPATNQDTTFTIILTKLHILLVTLSTQDNGKLSQHSILGF